MQVQNIADGAPVIEVDFLELTCVLIKLFKVLYFLMKAGQHFRDIGAKVEDICGF